MAASGDQTSYPCSSFKFWMFLVIALFGTLQGMIVYFDNRFELQLAKACPGSTTTGPRAKAGPHYLKKKTYQEDKATTNDMLVHAPLAESPSPDVEEKVKNPVLETNPTPNCTAPSIPKKKDYYYKERSSSENTFDGVKARAFTPWPTDEQLPCLAIEGKKNELNEPTDDGLLFLKPFKAGSSTAAGVHIRMSRNIAHRQNKTLCKMRFDHNQASQLFPQRNKKKSFLWTIARDPTSRLVSFFFHFTVSRGKKEPSDANFIEEIRTNPRLKDYYPMAFSPKHWPGREDPVAVANEILEYYDFIAVTERMDESVVAMAMLLGIPVADVLYLKAKGHGGYDAGGGRIKGGKLCTFIWPSFVTDTMEEFFETAEFQDIVRWDRAIHQAANRSLDLTIDSLGRARFEEQYALYLEAKSLAHDQCLPGTTFPCASDGKYRGVNDCMWLDSSCNNECLDKVAHQAGL